MAYREWQPWKNWQKRCSDRMNLYALKSDEGYLKIAENETCTLVGINKARVYPEAALGKIESDLKKHLNRRFQTCGLSR